MSNSKKHLNILIDTNIWLDYFLGRSGSSNAASVISTALANDDAIVTTTSIIKDAFFILAATLKRRAREDSETSKVDEQTAKVINQIAWKCISTIQSYSIMLNQGFQEHLIAMTLKDQHPDYEDDLLLAAAKSSKVDHVITNDKQLLANDVISAITPTEYVELRKIATTK